MRKALGKPRDGIVAALDIGSTKVCCLVARVGDKPDRATVTPEFSVSALQGVRIAGIGHQLSRGIKNGAVVDMEEAEKSILAAVHAAEKMAGGETISRVVVSLASGAPLSDIVDVEVPIGGHEVDEQDVRRVLGQGARVDPSPDRAVLHSVPTGFAVDGVHGIHDPRGMPGAKLGARMHVVTVSSGALRNLTTLINRCSLDIESIVASPFASGLSCLVGDERDLGATVVDFGGGTTTIAVFFDGQVVHVDTIPIGGLHVTNDIARGLATPVTDAERLKTLNGCATASSLDDRETIEVPVVGETEAGHRNQISRSLLIRIIQPRLEEVFELVRSRLEASGVDHLAGRRLVLTGGSSQMPGLRDLAQLILDKQVRIGRPVRIAGLADAAAGPAFSTAAGLLAYAVGPTLDAPREGIAWTQKPSGLFGRVGSWIRENF